MKLYSAALSPYAARPRIQIYAKGLDVEIVPPPGGLGADEFKRINPTGRVPCLEMDGQILPESQVICEYLEEMFPEPSLLPEAPFERARMRLITRLVDLDLASPLGVVFNQLDPAKRDAKIAAARAGEVEKAMKLIEGLLGKGPYAIDGKLTLADCAMAPIYALGVQAFPALGLANPLDTLPRTRSWLESVQEDPHVKRVHDEMQLALREVAKSKAMFKSLVAD